MYIRQKYQEQSLEKKQHRYRRSHSADDVTVKIRCDMTEVMKAEKRAKRLVKLLKEANALADELASKRIRLEKGRV